ncbi:MAG: HepT-like ribonuclease domain-containing protein [Atribacterota bacterium]
MYDCELLLELLRKILWSIEQILKRIKPIRSAEDFLKDDAGIEKLDSICMQLIAIGEAIKEIDRITDGKLLQLYPEVDWKSAKGMRDIIAHHYFDIDVEAVFNTCMVHIPLLRQTVAKIIEDLRSSG